MPISIERKIEVINTFKTHESDTGSPEVQVALMTEKIAHITEHLKTFKKDHSSRKGLLRLVSKRRSLLNYLKAKNVERYKSLIESLKIRK